MSRLAPSGPGPGIAAGWPALQRTNGAVSLDGRALAGFELAPLNLDLLADAERTAALESLAALYDAIPRPFQLVSIPARRDPNDHLGRMEEGLVGRRAKASFATYAARYRELAAAPRRPLRATYLVLDAGTSTELERTSELVRQVGEERGIDLRPIGAGELADLWSGVGGAGSEHQLGAHLAAGGKGLVAALHLGARWPSQVPPGWLTGLLATPGLAAVSMRVRPLSRAETMSLMTARLRHAGAGDRLAAERGEVSDPERERIAVTAAAARRAAQAGIGRVYLVDTILLVEAADRDTLHERLEMLRLEARGQQLDVHAATFRVADAWRATLPGPAGRPLAERNLDSASLAASLLHASSDLYEPGGHLYGVQRSSGTPIVLDRFGRPSHSAIVLGQTGTGKTMFTGAEMHRCFMCGIRILGVDPLGDYRRLVEQLGGTYVDLGAPGVGLNPFALTSTDPGAFSAKLAMLTRLVTAMAGGLAKDERPTLDRALRASYQAAGIGPDPASFGRRPPRLADLAARVGGEPGGAALARRLERWATGSLADVLGGEAAVPLDRRVLVVGLAAIGDPEVRAVAEFAALSVLWDAVRRDLAPKLVVVDEAWKVMRQPSGADFVEELARSARHYHAGLQLATQDIVEFLRSDFGEAIVKQCDLRVLLGQTPEAADALMRYFDLTPAERRALLHARPGEGLLFVGDSHAAFSSVVSDREYAMLTTRPADLTKTAQDPAADTS